MVYDFDGMTDTSPPKLDIKPGNPKDLEVIVQCVQIAALILTPTPDASFTFEELFAEMQVMGGGELVFDERDVRIVLAYPGPLKKQAGRYVLR